MKCKVCKEDINLTIFGLPNDICWGCSQNEEKQETLNKSLASSFTYEDLQKAFFAGCKFEDVEHKSWETYNKFTGNQQPNKEMNFEQWYEKNYESERKNQVLYFKVYEVDYT